MTPIAIFVFASLAILIVSIVCLACSFGRDKERARHLDAYADEQYRLWRKDFEAADGYLPEIPLPINLRKGEAGYFSSTSVTLCEPRAVRSGGYGGGSVRVAKGLSIHTGRFSSESHDEWREITTGNLYVTDKRIIFDGAIKNRVIDLEDVMSVAPGYRDACVNSAKLQKPVGFKNVNGQIFAAIISALTSERD